MPRFSELIYASETAKGQAITKAETHTPKIEVPEQIKPGEPFTVRVGVGPHPNTVQHSIRRIELYYYEEGRPFNPVRLVTIDLEPGYAEPKLEITLKLEKPGTLYAIAYCNLHGLWEARKEIKF